MSEKSTRQNWIINWLKPDLVKTRNQYLVYLAGCFTFSFGACCFIQSNLGTDPLDVFSLGLQKQLPWVTIGIAQGGFALLMLIIWAFWNKKLPIVSPFITFFFCGSLIDLGRYFGLAAKLPLEPFPLMLAGVMACGYGSSLIVMSGIGIRAMDLVAITMTYKLGAPFWLFKAVFEIGLLVSGWSMGGPVGIGTAFFLCFVGLLIQPMMLANQKIFGMKNHGLMSRKEFEAADQAAARNGVFGGRTPEIPMS